MKQTIKEASLELADILNTYKEDPETAENTFEMFSSKWNEDEIDTMCEMLEVELPWESEDDRI